MILCRTPRLGLLLSTRFISSAAFSIRFSTALINLHFGSFRGSIEI